MVMLRERTAKAKHHLTHSFYCCGAAQCILVVVGFLMRAFEFGLSVTRAHTPVLRWLKSYFYWEKFRTTMCHVVIFSS